MGAGDSPWLGDKPKWMRWPTFTRLTAEYSELIGKVTAAWAQTLAD